MLKFKRSRKRCKDERVFLSARAQKSKKTRDFVLGNKMQLKKSRRMCVCNQGVSPVWINPKGNTLTVMTYA